jgi:hypothetical protein
MAKSQSYIAEKIIKKLTEAEIYLEMVPNSLPSRLGNGKKSLMFVLCILNLTAPVKTAMLNRIMGKCGMNY